MAAPHLTPFEIGQVKAHLHHKLRPADIQKLVKRADGTPFSKTAIHTAVDKLTKDPTWRGQRAEGSGRQRKTSKSVDRKLVTTVKKDRGRQKVTVNYLKRRHPELRKVSNSTVEDRCLLAS